MKKSLIKLIAIFILIILFLYVRRIYILGFLPERFLHVTTLGQVVFFIIMGLFILKAIKRKYFPNKQGLISKFIAYVVNLPTVRFVIVSFLDAWDKYYYEPLKAIDNYLNNYYTFLKIKSILTQYYSKALSFNLFEINTYTLQGFLCNCIFFILPSLALYIFVIYPYVFLNTLNFKWFIRIGLLLSLRSIISYWNNTFYSMIHLQMRQMLQEYYRYCDNIVILLEKEKALKLENNLANVLLIQDLDKQQRILLAESDLLLAKMEKFKIFLKRS